jgi:Holliday junction resolvase-like predicted endonuclease
MFKRKKKEDSPKEASKSKRTMLDEKIRELDDELFRLDSIKDTFRISFVLATLFLVIVLILYSKHRNFLFWMYLIITPLYILTTVVSFRALNKFIRKVKAEHDKATKEREAEKKVQKFLEDNLTEGYYLFKNIYTGYGDIDAIVVGPTGIYMIEVKSNEGLIAENKEGYLSIIDGNTPNKNYRWQVAKQLSQVKKYLDNNTNMNTWVNPVLTFPFGLVMKDLVLESEHDKLKLPVMNEKELLEYIYSNKQHNLSSDQIKMVCQALTEWQKD